jgi:hypothetical protein
MDSCQQTKIKVRQINLEQKASPPVPVASLTAVPSALFYTLQALLATRPVLFTLARKGKRGARRRVDPSSVVLMYLKTKYPALTLDGAIAVEKAFLRCGAVAKPLTQKTLRNHGKTLFERYGKRKNLKLGEFTWNRVGKETGMMKELVVRILQEYALGFDVTMEYLEKLSNDILDHLCPETAQ